MLLADTVLFLYRCLVTGIYSGAVGHVAMQGRRQEFLSKGPKIQGSGWQRQPPPITLTKSLDLHDCHK